MKHVLIGLALATVAAVASAGDMMSKGGFKDLDKNTDGKLSAAEVSAQAGLSKDFKGADTDGDGYVSESEYNAWIAAHPAKPAETQSQPTTP
jgi:hypothetical protein